MGYDSKVKGEKPLFINLKSGPGIKFEFTVSSKALTYTLKGCIDEDTVSVSVKGIPNDINIGDSTEE